MNDREYRDNREDKDNEDNVTLWLSGIGILISLTLPIVAYFVIPDPTSETVSKALSTAISNIENSDSSMYYCIRGDETEIILQTEDGGAVTITSNLEGVEVNTSSEEELDRRDSKLQWHTDPASKHKGFNLKELPDGSMLTYNAYDKFNNKLEVLSLGDDTVVGRGYESNWAITTDFDSDLEAKLDSIKLKTWENGNVKLKYPNIDTSKIEDASIRKEVEAFIKRV